MPEDNGSFNAKGPATNHIPLAVPPPSGKARMMKNACIYMIVIGLALAFLIGEAGLALSVLGVIFLPLAMTAEFITGVKTKGALEGITNFTGSVGLLIFFIALTGAIVVPGMNPKLFGDDPGPLLISALAAGITVFFISAIIQRIFKKKA